MSFPPTVGRYRIERVLGSGAFASVWLGHDDALDSMVAIKVLSGSLLDDLDVRNRFLEEARILRRADSARLVRVHDIGELPDGRPYFVMSYADRGTLADRMRDRPLPVAEALVLAEEIAYGVEVINTLGVIHRDLKPSNVLFQSAPDGRERLLIADLGLAKALAHASGAFTLPVGTPGYMSPEQARFGGGLDVRADVYGLGALVFHMLTGRAPGPPPVRVAPSSLREGLPAAFDGVVLRALEVERERRWPTAQAFAEALSTLRPTVMPGAAAPARGGQPPPPLPTVQDGFYPAAASSYGPPHPAHPGGTGSPGSTGGPGGTGDPDASQLSTREDPPGSEDASRTSQMSPPPDQGPRTVLDGFDGDQTMVDGPGGGRYPAPAPQPSPPSAQPPPSGLPDDGRTISFSTPPPQGEGAQAPQTMAFPMQDPGQQPPPQGGGPYDSGRGPVQGPGGGPPGHPHGPGPGPGQGPLPTGFQPPGQSGKPPSESPLARLKKLALPGRSGGQGGPGGQSGPSGPTGPGGPGGAGAKRNVTPLVIAAAILAFALVGGLAIGVLLSGGEDPPPKGDTVPKDFVQVADAGGKIKAAVPKAWPKGQEPTWDPSTVRLGDGRARPVLRATPNVEDFKGSGASPGVFIGLTTDVANGKLPPPSAAVHPQCTKGKPENYTSPDKSLTGTITRYTACKTGTPSVVEVGLRHKSGTFGAWVRVKETDGRNATKDILDSLKLTAP
ncbi:hypothetical protein GCM10023085_58150 [Actinomadura viridis]|uniref:non-specific serine/threonine protein kinase n=1 Tax=Actinomadura viridis TaxID=58110 RepID=A0A931GN52_9ACTN|nr:serine/threonine-protein kinase [Actinomadura viridis]MBG6093392.1 serine/threonine protein kinase [Actinomadura viridis]